jgi:phage tail protein X
METEISVQGDTVDLICRRVYGDESGYVEAVLNANPGLAAIGPILPIGTAVQMPELEKPAELPTISLWD